MMREWSSQDFQRGFGLLTLSMSFSVFYEMHGTIFNLMFSALFHKINIIMNYFATLSVAFFIELIGSV